MAFKQSFGKKIKGSTAKEFHDMVFLNFSLDIYDQQYIKTYYKNEKEAENTEIHKRKRKNLLYHVLRQPTSKRG